MASYTYIDFSRTDIETNLTKDKSIKASVVNILSTARGSLPGKPEFGSDVHRYLFEPMNAFTKISLIDNIKSSLYRNDTRLANVNVSITEDKSNYKLNVTIEFTTKQDNEPQIITVNLKG